MSWDAVEKQTTQYVYLLVGQTPSTSMLFQLLHELLEESQLVLTSGATMDHSSEEWLCEASACLDVLSDVFNGCRIESETGW